MSSKSSALGGGLVVFSIVFLGVGIGSAGVMYWNSYTHIRMSHWDETEAIIKSVRLSRSTSSGTHGHSGGTTYKAEATYEYQYEEKTYVGQRVGIHVWGHDNLGSWQRDTHRRLERHKRQRIPHAVFVNPAHPTESVLDRELRLPVMFMVTLFALGFGGAGLAMLIGGLRSMSGRKHRERAIAMGQGWLVRDDWTAGEITSAPIRTLTWALPTTVLLAVVTVPTALMLPTGIGAGGTMIYLALIGPGLVVVFGLVSVRSVWRQLREGSTNVKLATIPGVIGGPLTGVIHTPRDLPSGTAVRVGIRCDKIILSGRMGKSGGSKHLETQWSDTQEIVADLTPGVGDGSAIPFDFAIPHGLPESSGAEEAVRWILTGQSLGEGPGFRMRCEVPLFVTSESSDSTEPRESMVDQYRQDISNADRLASDGVRIRSVAGGTQLRIRGHKTLLPMAFLTICMLIADTTSVALWVNGGSKILSVILGILGFFLTWGFLHTMLWGCRITILPSLVKIRSGATVFCKTHEIRPSDFGRLHVKLASSAGNHEFYEVFIGTDKTSIRIGKGIKGKQHAQAYAQAIWGQLTGADPPEVKVFGFGQGFE